MRSVERCLACEADGVATRGACLACEADGVATRGACLACEADGEQGPWLARQIVELRSVCLKKQTSRHRASIVIRYASRFPLVTTASQARQRSTGGDPFHPLKTCPRSSGRDTRLETGPAPET